MNIMLIEINHPKKQALPVPFHVEIVNLNIE
jgi:hypothetical protein